MLKRFVLSFAAVMNLLLLDQVVKEFAIRRLKGDMPITVIPNLFNLSYVENRGMAWGLLQGYVWPLAAFACLAMGVLIWKRRSIFPAGVAGTLAELLLYAGILGNLIDRLARGCVVDMFDFHWGVHHFPCFNVADSYITVAAGLLILLGLFEKQGEKKRERGRHDSA
jgi:signal peptidase II